MSSYTKVAGKPVPDSTAITAPSETAYRFKLQNIVTDPEWVVWMASQLKDRNEFVATATDNHAPNNIIGEYILADLSVLSTEMCSF